MAGKDPRDSTVGNADILFPSHAWQLQVRRPCGVRPAGARQGHRRTGRAALASWGFFQVLGYHAETPGYADVFDFVTRMQQDEGQHLEALVVSSRPTLPGKTLLEWLRCRDWPALPAPTTGRPHATNQYDLKLADAYARAAAQLPTP